MRKMISIMLVIGIALSCAVNGIAASGFSDIISSINDSVEDMYNSAESAPQQTQAMAFGAMYMLYILESEIDTDRSRTSLVSDLVSSITDSASSAEGAPQVSALSLYGCVAILGAIAYEKDTFGVYQEFISQTINSLTDANTTSAPQEMANAAYRMVDMLTILAYIEGVDSSLISNVNDTLSQNNQNLSGAPQQTANGLYRAAELLYLISQKAYSSKVSDLIYDLLDEMYTANESCSSAVQQTTNGMSTIYYMVMVLAMAKA